MTAQGMNRTFEPADFAWAHKSLIDGLLGWRELDGFWEGELSTSALSTATAVVALYLVDAEHHRPMVIDGVHWLARHANKDGGWGDTVRSDSNVSTTALAWAALSLVDDPETRGALKRAQQWLTDAIGGTEPRHIADAMKSIYGADQTFAVPIMTMLALCGRMGEGRAAWRHINHLPFELAAFPQKWYRMLQLPVVSYALPALIAIGQAIQHHKPTWNPVTGMARLLTRNKTMDLLARIQPENGGFLEAVPLTSFVVMSLASMGLKDHPVVKKGCDFLKSLVKHDGSWAIDTHLATWLTTLSVNALSRHGRFLGEQDKSKLLKWLLDQQYHGVHPFTGADPGGWAWTPLPGGVPDADDTSGAVIALSNLVPSGHEADEPAKLGLGWLAGLQNRDGGMPTFCRGWGNLPFDRSCPDITAHALQAFAAWKFRGVVGDEWDGTIEDAKQYLVKNQRADGSWVPLWFGNQGDEHNENPVYGTARVLLGLQAWWAMEEKEDTQLVTMIRRGRAWLRNQINEDGGYGGARGLPSSIEETALAIEALAVGLPDQVVEDPALVADWHRIQSAVAWLIDHVRLKGEMEAAPIGFYFANLWYFERLYPLIFATGALNAVAAKQAWFRVAPGLVSIPA
ncbi:prenyltransferase/squalene oxidase repeat-containing protein [Acanthopleuribacter pedis]|uniref:Squalene--hopene cyclase n=1 Tax=Acanthopleuribacter pedis TaxID=442870 RepID=A0A8J7QF13_9BACT|nr:prenyltransferase/squalene oxidase repeat-containing protein [Acanthopleuribacter pedis]MBO1323094.1 hypothetical protein [Acanthopleuribacter pedis]